MSPAFQKNDMLSEQLKLVIGDSNNDKILHLYHFPDPFSAKACDIFEKYEVMNNPSFRPVALCLPTTGHPIFGENGIMRQIVSKQQFEACDSEGLSEVEKQCPGA